MTEKYLTLPLTDQAIEELKIGDIVYISGVIYTARDAAHKRLCELVKNGKELPINLEGSILYFVGPTPAKPGRPIGSAGPTTSYRMDAYSPLLLEKTGLKGMIGKGERNKEVIEAIKRYHAVYFAAIGGAGALLSHAIKESNVVAYEDLGAEAIRKLKVEQFPVIVAIDSKGNNLYERKQHQS